MQVYANSTWSKIKIILFFSGVMLVAFLPVSSLLFFLKNDAFTGYFPPKFFMSEALHQGQLPLWNPYINYGFPQYGDMSGGYWSPITWLLAATIGYNAYTFTLEVLFYLITAGVGMYLLSGYWTNQHRLRLIAGVSFMCCGYFTGHLQHFNWLSGAALLPWCWWSYQKMMQEKTWHGAILAALIFYLFFSSAHPGIIIAAAYFFMAWTAFQWLGTFKKNSHWKSGLAQHTKWLVLLIVLSAGMIAGYSDILPHFSRGTKVSLSSSLLNPTNWKCWISALLPLSITKNDAWFATDISMRNVYMGLLPLLFFLKGCVRPTTRMQRWLLFTGICFALLSAGGVFKTFAYHTLPLIGYVRLNGEFRLFALLCFIAIAVIELQDWIANRKPFQGILLRIYQAVLGIIVGLIVFGIVQTLTLQTGLLFQLPQLLQQPGWVAKMKFGIDQLGFYDTLWLQGTIQLLILLALRRCLVLRQYHPLMYIVVIDLVLATILNVPFTGAGKASVKTVQTVLAQSPKGIPIPDLLPIQQHDTATIEVNQMVGHWSMYNKQIGTTRQVSYPINLNNSNTYFLKGEETGRLSFQQEPFVFWQQADSGNQIKILSFQPDDMLLTVHSNTSNQLVLQQNAYPYWTCLVNNQPYPIKMFDSCFMSIVLPKGTHQVRFTFKATTITRWALVSMVVLGLSLFYLLIRFVFPSWRRKRLGP